MLYVNSHLDELPSRWKSIECEMSENYKVNVPVYIHKLNINDSLKHSIIKSCRYGAKENERGHGQLWSSDFSWWISESPKAYADGMEQGSWKQVSSHLPPKTQLASDVIGKDIKMSKKSPFYSGKI